MTRRSSVEFLVILAVLMLTDAVPAAERQTPLSQRGVDQVTTASGQKLLGAVVHRSRKEGLVLAVRRGWLEQQDPGQLKKIDADNLVSVPRAWRQLLERLDRWQKTLTDEDNLLRAALLAERERVRGLLASLEKENTLPKTDFVLVVVADNTVRKVMIQPLLRKRVVLAAWAEGLADVEFRSTRDLEGELKRGKVAVAEVNVEGLWKQLPPREQDDLEWLARKTLKECQYEEPVHYQGTGGLLLAGGPDEAGTVDLQMVGQLIGQLVDGDLGKLLESLGVAGTRPQKPGGIDPLVNLARRTEQAGGAGFRVTRFAHDLERRRTTVTSRFVVRVTDEIWVTLWQGSQTVAIGDRPQLQQRIARDPRVKPLLEIVKKLGLPGGDEALKTALEFGAATMEGQQRLDSQFTRFQDRYLRRLDGPPLWFQARMKVQPVAKP